MDLSGMSLWQEAKPKGTVAQNVLFTKDKLCRSAVKSKGHKLNQVNNLLNSISLVHIIY